MEQVEYCRCKDLKSVYTQSDDFGHWDVCSDCNKVIEDSYEYFSNEIDIEDD